MIKNYLTIALRNLLRYKVFSLINMTGLAIGMAGSLLILLWVGDELRYDRFHANEKNLYRVLQTQYYDDGKANTGAATPGLLAETLKRDIPEVAQATTVTWKESLLIAVGEKTNREEAVYAGEDLFKMFSFPLLTGNPETVLASPDNIAISQQLARKYFGEDNPIGKTVRVDNRKDFRISAVFADLPQYSSLRFDLVLPFKDFSNQFNWVQDWQANGPQTFLLLKENVRPESVNAKIKYFLKSKQRSDKTNLFVQPFADAYLYGHFKDGRQNGGRIDYVWLFSAVAIFVLLIACINFMNLATARSVKRAKEVGIRKVMGATQQRLIGQFLGEALLIAGMAGLFSLLLVDALLPFFNSLTGKHLVMSYASPKLVGTLVGLITITGLVSGSYPALFLSSLQPAKVLKGSWLGMPPGRMSNVGLRQGLVVFQFALAILLMVGMVVFHRQIAYVQTKNLGFDRENIVYSWMEGDLAKNFTAFKNELSHSAGIQSVSTTTQEFFQAESPTVEVQWAGKNPNEKIPFYHSMVNYGFIETMKIELKEGRDFSPAYGNDSLNFIINEEAARRMRLKNPVGQQVIFWNTKGTIIGVVKDFHVKSMHSSIEPLFLRLEPQPNWGYVIVRTQPGQTREALSSFKKLHKKFNPYYPFTYGFAEDAYQQQYRSETIMGQLANWFSVLAIVVSCLGLFGLATFTAEQRTKEIGIRKVLGASVSNIVALLSKDFLKLVLIANVIAWPLAWWAMQRWLEDFAYHIEVSWWVFVGAGLVALVIALLTVSFQAVKAALANPVKSLRTE